MKSGYRSPWTPAIPEEFWRTAYCIYFCFFFKAASTSGLCNVSTYSDLKSDSLHHTSSFLYRYFCEINLNFFFLINNVTFVSEFDITAEGKSLEQIQLESRKQAESEIARRSFSFLDIVSVVFSTTTYIINANYVYQFRLNYWTD